MAKLQRSVKLTVAGEGPERDALESLARELGCHEHVQWLGAVENDTVHQLMHQADVFVLPCRTDPSGDRDGLPVVLIEAMASGLTVVTGNLPPIRELIEHGSNGILVPENDDQQLAYEIESLTDEVRRNLAAAARTTVESEFSLDETIERLENHFCAALDSGGG
jgi:glycosyltransferase involved in cell wall biosynthesis